MMKPPGEAADLPGRPGRQPCLRGGGIVVGRQRLPESPERHDRRAVAVTARQDAAGLAGMQRKHRLPAEAPWSLRKGNREDEEQQEEQAGKETAARRFIALPVPAHAGLISEPDSPRQARDEAA
ncbi:hypothetical protein [Rhodobacter sp. CZR27]|uniref:hypothetical protein n=1 Tax=Rhodobacter sp. CZR27 TaxID=2033869 RepID=UPI0012FD5AC7|nr:hypothetical protein [Rhodobacter sp. CZR27]